MDKTNLKIKIKLKEFEQIQKIVKSVKEIEKEHSCHCTLIDIEIC